VLSAPRRADADLAFVDGLAGEALYEVGELEIARAVGELAPEVGDMADHYLTDAFSGGHIRTPRDQLTGSAMGNIRSNVLHDLDNQFGVRVANARGDTPWIAYGDERFFTPENADNRRIVQEAVRLSRQDITDALAGGSPGAAAFSSTRSSASYAASRAEVRCSACAGRCPRARWTSPASDSARGFRIALAREPALR
jgi:hypothetical protein